MLNPYAVKVWYASQPTRCETIEVRTYSARRAENLARESFPGCMALTNGMFVDGTWYDAPFAELTQFLEDEYAAGRIPDGPIQPTTAAMLKIAKNGCPTPTCNGCCPSPKVAASQPT